MVLDIFSGLILKRQNSLRNDADAPGHTNRIRRNHFSDFHNQPRCHSLPSLKPSSCPLPQQETRHLLRCGSARWSIRSESATCALWGNRHPIVLTSRETLGIAKLPLLLF
jgi:hypothetical protein